MLELFQIIIKGEYQPMIAIHRHWLKNFNKKKKKKREQLCDGYKHILEVSASEWSYLRYRGWLGAACLCKVFTEIFEQWVDIRFGVQIFSNICIRISYHLQISNWQVLIIKHPWTTNHWVPWGNRGSKIQIITIGECRCITIEFLINKKKYYY